jgi:hypothetical protein
MNTKTTTIILIALLSATAACDGQVTKDDDRTATFAEATDTQISDAFYVGSGMDLIMSTMWGTAPILAAELGSPCVTVTEVEGGVQYENNGNPNCESGFSGKVTTYGDVSDGGKGTVVWDNMEWVEAGSDAAYTANGTLSVGPGYLEADLVHTLPGFGEIENHARFEVEGDFLGAMSGDADARLVHAPGSWAAIDGLGSFDMSGTHDLTSGEMDLALMGTDTLTIYMAPDFACFSIEIDGEPVETEDVDTEICED